MIWKTRHFADVGAIALATSILVTGSLLAGSAQAAQPPAAVQKIAHDKNRVIQYVALGDSYAAGQGAAPYEDPVCLQSQSSYPELLDDVKRVRLLRDASCSGATMDDVRLEQIPTIQKNRKIDLVTLTIGANDVIEATTVADGGNVLTICSVGLPADCNAAIARALALLTPPAPAVASPFAQELTETLTAVVSATPNATILVTGYPRLFETPPPEDPRYVAIASLNAAIDALNATIAAVAGELRNQYIDVRYVDVAGAFAGHGIGSPDPWINPPLATATPEAFHPTAAGYVQYAAALRAALHR